MQIEMTSAVERAMEAGGVLLAEAGTGTGKTLAYLVPAFLSDRTVIVSTGTKNLQEQVFFKDIGFLSEALGTPLNAVYLKGQNNYLCRRRYEEFLTSPKVLAHAPRRVAELKAWAENTETGDQMELESLPDNDPLWREVCSTRDTRIGSKCRIGAECFVARARLQAMQAEIVVVNHHLYFADVATRLRGGSILPAHDVVVFDEAHLVEDVATEFFSTAISSGRIDRALNDVRSAIRSAKIADDPAETRRDHLIDVARSAMNELFAKFRGPHGRVRLIPEEIASTQTEAYHRLDAALEAVSQSLKAIEGRDDGVDHVTQRIESLRGDLSLVLTQTARGYVHWVENRKRTIVIGASPIDVSELLRENIFFTVPTVVLTSATLSTGGDFSFLKNRIGIDFDVEEISLPSPFDYRQQARIYSPEHLPDPRDEEFLETSAAEAEKLIALTEGGALLLFTSLRAMRETHRLLQRRVPEPLLLQGEAPRSVLLGRFFEGPHAVLCATASFWQGVDIPGDALRLVIIDKLPFASPGDPLVAARIEHLKETGHRPFFDYQVPQAALALKQGVGRLIRTKFDRGIVAILDRRLKTMPYARVFWRSLPESPVLNNVAELGNWWTTLNRQGGSNE